jgi:hypothetical protein
MTFLAATRQFERNPARIRIKIIIIIIIIINRAYFLVERERETLQYA